MKIISATVDKRPRECSACPICAVVRSRAPCGQLVTIQKDHAAQTIQVPDIRCKLKKQKL